MQRYPDFSNLHFVAGPLPVLVVCAVCMATAPAFGRSSPFVEPSARSEETGQRPTSPNFAATSLDAATAVRLALESSPGLAVARMETEAARAGAMSGGRWDNPEISMEWEEFGLSRPAWSQSELTFRIEQAFPLGGKLPAERRLASARAGRMEHRGRLAAVELEIEVRQAHLAALAEQARIELLAESLEMAVKVLEAVRTAIVVGHSAPADEHLALAEFRSEEVAMRRASARFEELKGRLAATWGGMGSQVGRLVGSLEPSPVPQPGLTAPSDFVEDGSPRPLLLAPVAALQAEKRAALDLEKQRAIPEISVMGGIRGIEGFSDQAFVAGLSIPLPAWNRNQAEVEIAGIELRRAESLLRARERDWRAEVAAERAAAFQAWQDYQGIRDGVLPELEKGLVAVLAAFQGGDVGSLEVLDVQRRVLAVRLLMLDAAEASLAAGIRLEGLLRGTEASTEGGLGNRRPELEEAP